MKTIITFIMALLLYSNLAYSHTLESYIDSQCNKNCVSKYELIDAIYNVKNDLVVNYRFILAIIKTESNFNKKAKNGSSIGLMQVHLRYHRSKFNSDNYYNPNDNIRVGVSIFNDCYSRKKGNLKKTLRCYNGGGDPNYVSKVYSAYKAIKSLHVSTPKSNQSLILTQECSMSVMNVYACGGAGINVASQFAKKSKPDNGFADIKVFFIDTSRSNIGPNIPSDAIYITDGLDGSGKKRDSNYNTLLGDSKDILHQYRPSDINIVIHSGSGGTGSVIGPILVSELLNRGELVIPIIIGSTSSKIETSNTLKTLQSYEVISRNSDMPIVAAYKENSVTTPRGHIDAEIQTTIALLSVMFSGTNRELDTADLKNFIHYNKLTSYGAGLSLLDFYSGDVVLNKGQTLISVVTLTDDDSRSDVNIPVEYQACGYLSDSAKSYINIARPIHACAISGYYSDVVANLNNILNAHSENRSLHKEKNIAAGISSTDQGLVL